MPYNPDRHHRRSIRLRGYDYTLAGAYYVTLVTQDRAPLFGDVTDGVMQLNDAGRMVQTLWDEIPAFYPGVEIDAFIIMPNHIHGIIVLTGGGADPVGAQSHVRPANDGQPGVGADPRVRPLGDVQPNADNGQPPPEEGQPPPEEGQPPPEEGQPRGVAPTLSLGDVISRFKTLTTKRYTDGVNQSGWTPYRGRVWQRNYYEHIIRDDPSLQRIRAYIESNPEQWAADAENPAKVNHQGGNSVPAPIPDPLIPKHGGYRNLKSFQVAQLAYDVTVRFCDRYIDPRSRTHDQMVQAARSGVQNIAEGSQASGTSKKMEMKLTNVARASLEELRLDYEDYLRQRGLEQWPPDHPILMRFKKHKFKTVEQISRWVEEERRLWVSGTNTDQHGQPASVEGEASVPVPESPKAPGSAQIVANAALSLLNLATYLLDRQLAAQAKAFEEEGGFTERLYRTRQQRRKGQ